MATKKPAPKKKPEKQKKAPPKKPAAPVKKSVPPPKKAPPKKPSPPKKVESVKKPAAKDAAIDIDARLIQISALTEDQEIFHKTCRLFKEALGSSFVNLYRADELTGQYLLTGVHHRDSSYFINLSEESTHSAWIFDPKTAVEEISKTAVIAQAQNIPVVSIKEDKLFREETPAVSALYVPVALDSEGRNAGFALFFLAEGQPHFTASDTRLAEKMLRPWKELLLRRCLAANRIGQEAARQSLLKEIRASKKTITEKDDQFEKTIAAHTAAIDELKRDQEEKFASASARHESEIAEIRGNLEKQIEEEKKSVKETLEKEYSDTVRSLTEQKSNSEKQIEHLTQTAGAAAGELTEVKNKLAESIKKYDSDTSELRQAKSELEKKISASAADAEAGKKQSADKIRALETELALVKEAADKNAKQSEASIRDLSEKLSVSRGQLEKVERALEDTKKNLERDLQTVRSELEKKESAAVNFSKDAQSQIDSLKKELTSAQSSLKSELDAAEKLKSDLAGFKGRVQELENLLSSEKTASEKNRVFLEQQISAAKNSYAQKETNLLQEVYDLKQTITSNSTALQQQKLEYEDKLAKLSGDREAALAENREIISGLEESLRDIESKLSVSFARQSELENQRQIFAKRNEELEQEISSQKMSLETSQEEIDSLSTAMVRLKQDQEKELQNLKSDYTGQLEKTGLELEKFQNLSADLREKLTDSENTASANSREIQNLKIQREELERKISALERNLKEAREENEKKEIQIAEQQEEKNQLLTRLKLRMEELEKSRESETHLKQEIAVQKDREIRLEQAIAGLESEKQLLKGAIARNEEDLGGARRSLADLEKNIKNLQSDVADASAREKKLSEELQQAQNREKYSRREGHLLALAAHTLSNAPDFTEKLKILAGRMPGEQKIGRIVVYSLIDEGFLEVKDAVDTQTGNVLLTLRGRRIALSQTVFGQTLATGEIQALPLKKDSPPDVPFGGTEEINSEKLRYFLGVPLLESEKVIGLMTVAGFIKEPSDDMLRFLKNISPLIAIALKYERNHFELEEYKKNIGYYDEVGSFLQYRSLKSAQEIQSIVGRLQENLQNPASPTQTELLRRLESAAQRPLAKFDEKSDLAEMLQSFIIESGKLAASKTGLSFEYELPADILGSLHSRIGRSIRNLFWLVGEAVDNTIRHSQAGRLWIALTEDDENFDLLISDNGEGIVRTSGKENPDGMGLKAIRNLAFASGGEASFEKGPQGYGLSVRVAWSKKP